MTAFAVAHRGLSAEYAENTIAAFQAAAHRGFPALELDLRCTADGEVVVLHDAGVDRTTDGSGRVADMQYDELRTYDTGEGPVPRLDDLFTALQDYTGLWDLEIKDRKATRDTLDLVRHHGLEDHALLSSLDPTALQEAQSHAPEVTRGFIALGEPDEEDLRQAHATRCTWFLPDQDFLEDQSDVARLTGSGFRVAPWTVNEVDRAAELVSWGCRAIITDRSEVADVLPGRPRTW